MICARTQSEMNQFHATDVAARDGLQNQSVQLGMHEKLELIRLFLAVGAQSVEATSFVSPRAVSQMADAGDMTKRVGVAFPAFRASALVPNLEGRERALAAGAKEIAVVLAATGDSLFFVQ